MTEEEAEISKKINGEVRLSLKDYTQLLSNHVVAEKRRKVYEDATMAVGNFLQFIMKEDKDHFNSFVDSFNEQSDKLKIYIDDYGKPRMGLKND